MLSAGEVLLTALLHNFIVSSKFIQVLLHFYINFACNLGKTVVLVRNVSLSNMGWQRVRGQFGFRQMYRKLVFQRGLAHFMASKVLLSENMLV